MKHAKINLTIQLIGALCLMTFFACNKEQTFTPEEVAAIELPDMQHPEGTISTDIKIENDVLVFQNTADYQSTLLGLNKMSKTATEQWETSTGFNSMQQQYYDIMTAEWEKGAALHSDLYLTALDNDFIVEDEFGYRLNIFSTIYAPVLSEDGFVKVGNNVLQFTADALKIWENGDVQQLELLTLTNANTDQITIVPMSLEVVEMRNPFTWHADCEDATADAMMKATLSFISDYVDPAVPEIIFIDYFLSIKTQIQNENGEWLFDDHATIKVEGISHLMFSIWDGNEKVTKNHDSDYFGEGFGGDVNMILPETGNWELPPPFYFAEPAQLVSTNFNIYNYPSNEAALTCSISK